MKNLLRNIFVFMVAVSVMAACDEPEPTPTPDPTPSAADSVAVNLPDLTAFSSSDMFDSDLVSSFGKTQEGTLTMSFAGTRQVITVDALKDYDGGAPIRRYCDYPISYTFDMGARKDGTGDGEELSLASMNGTKDLGYRSKEASLYLSGMPKDLKSLDDVTFTEDSRIDVTLAMVNPWFTDGTITPTFSVDMRKFFNAKEAEEGILTFDAVFTKQNGWKVTKTFHIGSVMFNPDNFDADGHKLKLDAVVGLSGKVLFQDLMTTRKKQASAPDRVQMAVTVVLRDVEVETVTGTFAFSAKSDPYELPMKGLRTSGTQLLDMSGAKLSIDAVSDIPVGSIINTTVDAHAGSRSLAKAGDLEFNLPATTPGTPVEGWGEFGQTSSEAMSTLLGKAFDSFQMTSTVATDQFTKATFRVGESFDVVLAPVMECPVVPKAGFVINHKDTLAVPQALVNALKEGDIRLVGTVTNTLPTDITLSVEGFNSYGGSLVNGIEMKIPAEGSVPVDIVIKNKVGSSIDGLSMFVMTTSGVFGESTRALKINDAVKADISFVVHK